MKMSFRVSILLVVGVYLSGQVASGGPPDPMAGSELLQDGGENDQEVDPAGPPEDDVSHEGRENKAPTSQNDRSKDPDGSIPAGSTYTRWGQTSCREGAALVYEGVMAGKQHGTQGSGTNYLCLHKSPEFQDPSSGFQGGGSIYGIEAGFIPMDPTLRYQTEIPCAVCMAPGKHDTLMIPGIKDCPGGRGWKKEYQGYLGSGHDTDYATEYICLDHEAKGIGAPRDGYSGHSLLYQVEAWCPPYEKGYEVTCVVCSI